MSRFSAGLAGQPVPRARLGQPGRRSGEAQAVDEQCRCERVRDARQPARIAALALVALLAGGGCVTERPGYIDVPRPTVNVRTYDAAGNPTDGQQLTLTAWSAAADPTRLPPVREVPPRSEAGGVVATAVDSSAGAPAQPSQPSQVSQPPQAPQQAASSAAPAAQPSPPPPQAEPQTPGQGQQRQQQQEQAQAQEPVPTQAQQDVERRLQEEAQIRNTFGNSVWIGKDGRVTNQYFLPTEVLQLFKNLIGATPGAAAAPVAGQPAQTVQFGGDKNPQSVLTRMLGDHQVELVLIENFEPIEAVAIRRPVEGYVPNTEPPISQRQANALLLVTAKPVALAAFENALNLFFTNIPQIEIEVKVIEYTWSDSLSYGVVPLDKDTPTLRNQQPGRLIRGITSDFPLSAPFAAGGGALASQGTLLLGAVHDGWELNARLQALETNGVVDILSQPKLVVRNGGIATVSTVTSFPFPKAKFTLSGSNAVSDIDFKDVGITLNILPRIAGTRTVSLQIYATVSAITGFADTEPVPTPIISTRSATTNVHVRDNQVTTIGGLVTQNEFDSVAKIPLLGDIPILGYLFRSTSKQKSKTTLEFIIIPHIRIGEDQSYQGSPAILGPLR